MTGEGFDLHYTPPAEVVQRAKDAYDPLPWRLRLWSRRAYGALVIWILAPMILAMLGPPPGPMRAWLVAVGVASLLAGWAAGRWA